MDVSIFLARALGLYLVIVCFAFFFRYQQIQAIYEEMFVQKTYILFGAIISLIVGILLVISHPVFTADWRSLITIIAWLSLIKGVMLLYFPNYFYKYKSWLLSNAAVYYGFIIIFFLIGIFLIYHGFWA